MTNKESQQFANLLEKYWSNSLSEEEFQIFLNLLGQELVKQNELLDAQAAVDWQGSRAILKNIRIELDNRKNRSWWISVLGKSAAAIVLVCTVWFFWPGDNPLDLHFHTTYGETRNIALPDGSQVLLNANSTLTWINGWEDRNQRKVILSGEAFFVVKNAKDIPFEVHTPQMKVRVLGTEFNVKSRGDETQVFLHAGKINLDIEEAREETVEMVPGDFVRFNHVDHTLESVSHTRKEEKVSWVDGMLEFRNVRVAEVLEEFENLYGKKFMLGTTELLEKRMDLSLPYANWDLVRKALEIALGVEFSTATDTIIMK